MIAAIVLCIVYEAYRNRELALIKEMGENAAKGAKVEEADPYEGAETERPIVAAPQVSRAGDHSVVQDDEDFSDSDE